MEQTIAAIATAPSPGGIGIIRISGADAFAVADRVFTGVSGKKTEQANGYTALFGHIMNGEETVDEAVALVFRAPKSYTGEHVVELSCHGGPAILQETLRLTLAAGARLAQPGEFTRRAFMNGKMGLTQAEAVMDLISAKGKEAARAAMAVKDGALARQLDAIEEVLTNTAAWLAAWADFPEEEIPEVDTPSLLARLQPAIGQINRLIAGFDNGRMIREGIETVIIGCPNVGKSTLMNYLCGYESSIVTAIPGTTRDVVSEDIMLGDVQLHLSDTAGIRDTEDTVEQFGVERAKKRLETASLVFAVFDASRPLEKKDKELLALCEGKTAIAIVNKTDLPTKADLHQIRQWIPHVVQISAKEQTGRDQLQQLVKELLQLNQIDPTQGFLSNGRQLECANQVASRLQECVDAIHMGLTLDAVSVCLETALDALAELSGKRVTDQVADRVFHQFCVGK